MSRHELQERLVNGFKPHGYELYADDNAGINSEFRKPGAALRFCVKYGEGGVLLLWTESPEHDLLDFLRKFRKLPQDVDGKSFCGSPEEFWQSVADIVEGKTV